MRRIMPLAALLVFCALGSIANATTADGTTWAPYGSRPVVHCRPLYLTDVVLEPGEHVSTLAIGDSVRWRLGRGIAGPHGSVQHLFIKPSAFATTTNLEVLTDRRVYDVELVSDGRRYTARLAFYAPPVPNAARRQTAVAIDAERPALPPRAHPRSKRVRFFRDYFIVGTMHVSHTMDRTYVSIDGPLRGSGLTFTSDAAGRRFLAVVRRRGSTYELREVAARLYVWSGARRSAYALRWAT